MRVDRKRTTAVVLVVAVAVSAVAFVMRSASARVSVEADARRLSAVGMVALLFSQDHGGAYPDSFATALHDEDQPAHLACCALASDSSKPDLRYPYVYLARGWMAGAIGITTVIAYSPLAYTNGPGSNVLFGDSHARWVTAADLPDVLARGGPSTRTDTGRTVHRV